MLSYIHLLLVTDKESSSNTTTVSRQQVKLTIEKSKVFSTRHATRGFKSMIDRR
jgi:hypothetical protein